MTEDTLFQVRATGLLVESGKLLIVKQRVSADRGWSLPGGKLRRGETIAEGMAREIAEETGLTTGIVRLLYVCDMPEVSPPVLHLTFLLRKIAGELRLPSNDLETTPISDVKMVPIAGLSSYGFSARFCDLVMRGFPGTGCYVGPKSAIGL